MDEYYESILFVGDDCSAKEVVNLNGQYWHCLYCDNYGVCKKKKKMTGG